MRGGRVLDDPHPGTRKAGCTHPTGMLSCYFHVLAPSLCLHYTSLLSVLGQLHWLYTALESERNWAVVHDLVQGVLYELRVVARNGDEEDAPETSSPVHRIRLGSKIGKCPRVWVWGPEGRRGTLPRLPQTQR